ncbi:MAG: YwaF family protein [Oscillospiraceae bacterium]
MIIRPFNAAYLLLLAFAAGAVVLLWALLRGRSERCRAAVLIALCAVNIIGFFVYKGFLSRDVQFLQASGLDRFNWFSELPLQLCNINMFLIPIGILTQRRSLLGFAFFVAPLGALMALVFPEAPFVGYCLWLPRMLGFYVTHMLIIVCGLSLVTLGFYRPNFRDIPGITGTSLLLGIGALAVNFLLRHTVCPLANYFFVYGRDVDISILNLFWKWLPVPFLYEMPALLILVGYMALICLLFSVRDQRRAREIDMV